MLEIAKKVIVTNIRNSRNLYFNMLFPIFLMALIGGLLVNDFKKENNIRPINVYYYDKGSAECKEIFQIVQKEKLDLDITFIKIHSIKDGKEKVRINKAIFVFLNGDKIEIYGNNSENPIYVDIINNLFNGVSKRKEIITEMYKLDPSNAENILKDNENYNGIEVKRIPTSKSPTSFDYYGVAELTMMCLYLILYPFWGMGNEIRMKIKERILLTGISNFQYNLGTLLGYWIISIITTLPGFIFSKIVLKTNWGPNLVFTYFTILILNLMVISCGMLISTISKENDKVKNLINVLILPLLSFLGGSYIAIPDQVNIIFQIITNISPIRWINRGIFRMAFAGDYSIIFCSVAINIVLTLIFLTTLFIVGKKQEALQ